MKKALIIILVLIVVGVGVYFFFKDDLSGVGIADLRPQAGEEGDTGIDSEEAERIRKLNMDGVFEGWETYDKSGFLHCRPVPYLCVDKFMEMEPDERRKTSYVCEIADMLLVENMTEYRIKEPFNLDIYGIDPEQESIFNKVESVEFYYYGYDLEESGLDEHRRTTQDDYPDNRVYQLRKLNTDNPEGRMIQDGDDFEKDFVPLNEDCGFHFIDQLYAVSKWDKSNDKILLYEYYKKDPDVPEEAYNSFLFQEHESLDFVYVIFNIRFDPEKDNSWLTLEDCMAKTFD